MGAVLIEWVLLGWVIAAAVEPDSIPGLRSGDARLEAIPAPSGGWGVALRLEGSDGAALRYEQPQPLYIEAVQEDGAAHLLHGAYDAVEPDGVGWIGRGTVVTRGGTVFAFTDRYGPSDEPGAFTLDRTVEVRDVAPGDMGFSSRFALRSMGPADSETYDVFVPGVWYGRNENVPRRAIGGDYSDAYFYFREARATAPVCMLMDRASGTTISLTHLDARPETFSGDDYLPRLIDARLQFGAFGLEKGSHEAGPLVAYLFPGSEGEKTYIEGSSPRPRWARRSHPVRPDVAHAYRLLIRLEEHPDFQGALKSTWRKTYAVCDPPLVRADIVRTYRDGVDLLARMADHHLDTPGFPFSVDLEGHPQGYNYLMGFVGHQVLCAYHLLHVGLTENRPELRARGEAIVDFWATRPYDGNTSPDTLPHTWWQPEEPPGWEPGKRIWGQYEREKFWRDEPNQGEVFLRTLSDGHLALLRAWRLMRDHGIDRPGWIEAARRFGRWLATHQNEDGSFYRKYRVTGEPLETSKLNTTHPIPFLALLYQVTDDASFRTAALRAGAFCWEAIHRPALYVGGTTDNPNTIDKEAAYLALDAFLALHDLDPGDPRWLEAAEQAATFGETWTYIWDIPMPLDDEQAAPFDAIHTAGLSLVATGHTYADCFNAFYPFAYYRLYRLTGDRHYFDYANLILHNTKQMLDTDGSKGYGHPGLQTEGIGMEILRGHGPRVWLPWITAAQIDAPHRLQQTYGAMTLEECERLPPAASAGDS